MFGLAIGIGQIGQALPFIKKPIADSVDEEAPVEPMQLPFIIAGLIDSLICHVNFSHDSVRTAEASVLHPGAKHLANPPLIISRSVAVKKLLLGIDQPQASFELLCCQRLFESHLLPQI